MQYVLFRGSGSRDPFGFREKSEKLKVDEKAMIENRYNRLPHPSPDTIRERNANNQDGNKEEKTAKAENQDVSSFPADVHQAILNIINK